jgi:SAM-dependent methyltransferase
MMLKGNQDAFGHAVYDCFQADRQRPIVEVVERDDGMVNVEQTRWYFSTYKEWPTYERKAMRYVRGRVLDIGSGAGRHSLYLQQKGLEVVAIDNSPLALEVCRLRGLRSKREIPINKIDSSMGIFDTVLMLCNNFGLLGDMESARRLLKRINNITSRVGRIIAESSDIYQTDNPDHLSYHMRNRNRGRMSGQIRMRVRYLKYATPWFDYLQVSREEMKSILEGSGWFISRIIESSGPRYIAIIDKKNR